MTRRRKLLRAAELFFWAIAVVFLGLYALVYADRSLYQAYESWAFNRKIEHRGAPVIGFLFHELPFGRRSRPAPPPPSADAPNAYNDLRGPVRATPLATGALLGRIDIPRVGIDAMVVNGTTDECLRHAVGHIEGTAMPGSPGNVALAGHRDTFFRPLRHIRPGDLIEVQTLAGTFRYRVESTKIVDPDDVEVLDASAEPTLTLVTCYPFYYVGAAPHRFIVRARQVKGEAAPAPNAASAVPAVPGS